VRALGVEFQATRPWATHARHLFVIRHAERDAIGARLRAVGVETGVHYPLPVHRQPALATGGWRAAGPLAVTEALAESVLSLPLYPELGDSGVDRVSAALAEALP
jgi:dTDP-4-amino-4,6-dideoxygalactose transaminase